MNRRNRTTKYSWIVGTMAVLATAFAQANADAKTFESREAVSSGVSKQLRSINVESLCDQSTAICVGKPPFMIVKETVFEVGYKFNVSDWLKARDDVRSLTQIFVPNQLSTAAVLDEYQDGMILFLKDRPENRTAKQNMLLLDKLPDQRSKVFFKHFMLQMDPAAVIYVLPASNQMIERVKKRVTKSKMPALTEVERQTASKNTAKLIEMLKLEKLEDPIEHDAVPAQTAKRTAKNCETMAAFLESGPFKSNELLEAILAKWSLALQTLRDTKKVALVEAKRTRVKHAMVNSEEIPYLTGQ